MKKYGMIMIALLCVVMLAACSNTQGSVKTEQNTETVMSETEQPQVTEEKAEDAGPVTMKKLEIVSMPDKTKYYSGEAVDLSGLRINAIMTDGSVQENVPWETEEGKVSNRATSISVTCMGAKLMIPIEVIHAGNAENFSLDNTETIENSPVKGNLYFWLGSSVTYGASSDGVSMADFFAKKWDCTCIKEAVSGTTLCGINPNSYVERFNRYLESPDRAEHLDGFICQLSTNDTRNADAFGMVMPEMVTASDSFDVKTTFGAMEYILAKVRETWNCPVYFYTNPPFGNSAYEKMVQGLEKMQEKWHFTIIDMYRDDAFNQISEEQRSVYLADSIHPTKAGYRDWWLVKFETALLPEGTVQ